MEPGKDVPDLSKLMGGAGGSGEDAAAAEAQKQEMEEARKSMLKSILSPEAFDRLSRVSLVKPEIASRVGNQLLQMAQKGQIRSKVEEGALITMLEGVSEAKKEAKVTIQRRSYFKEEDDPADYDF